MVHQIDTVHWFTGLPRPRSVVANGGIYFWHDGRKNWDTMTAVFDYGPLNDSSKGFQVVYSSRMTNEAGEVKELYYSNGGTLDLDKRTVSPEGGLTKEFAGEMNMQPNLLPKLSLTNSAATCRRPVRIRAAMPILPLTFGIGWNACAAEKRRTRRSTQATAIPSRSA